MAVNVSSFPTVVAFPTGNPVCEPGSRRCTFSRTRGRWTLQADCELSAPLELPANVSLDGAGYSIVLSGDAEGFESAAIRAHGGDVINLTVDGSRLLPIAPAYFAAVALTAPGRISQITVRDIQFSGAPHSAIGIEVAAFGNASAIVEDITLQNISGAGLLLTGDGRVTVERVAIDGLAAAVQVNGTIEAKLNEAVVERSQIGVLAQDQSCVRINSTAATGEIVAEDQALIHQATLTFIGAGNRDQVKRRSAATAAAQQNRLG